jgi:hypothetical protein
MSSQTSGSPSSSSSTSNVLDKVRKHFDFTTVCEHRADFQRAVTAQDLEFSASDTSDGFPQFVETPINPPQPQLTQQSANLRGKLNSVFSQSGADRVAAVEIDDIVSFPAFTDVTPVGPLTTLKPSDDELRPPTTPTAGTIIKDEPVNTAAVLRDIILANEQDNMARDNSNLTDRLASPFVQAQSPTIVATASTETDGSTKHDTDDAEEDAEEDAAEEEEEEKEEGNRENMTRFKTWGAPVARNKPRMTLETSVPVIIC